MRRGLLVAIALVVLLPAMLGLPAAGQQSPAGESEYSLEELREGGRSHAGAPPSMRFLGQYGSATLRHEPVGFGTDEWAYVKPGGETMVQKNEVTLRTIRLGDPDSALTVRVVSWNEGERTIQTENGTRTEPVARNVSEQVIEAEAGRGYDNSTIALPASFEDQQHITMWVEEYPEARWHFTHRSVGTTRPIDISSWGDFLSALFWKIGVWAIPALLIGGALGRRHRERAIVGPQWGLAKWGIALSIPIGLLSTYFAFQGSILATRIPQGIALITGILGYALVLEAGDMSLEKFLFRRQELESATTPRGEESHDSRFVDHAIKKGVRRERNQELVLIEPGLSAYIGRLRGQVAALDVSDLVTHKKGQDSPFAMEIELDPEFDFRDALIHKPPRISRKPLMSKAELPLVGETEIPNLGVVVPLGAGVGLGWLIADQTLGLPGVGAVVGVIVALPFIHEATDGGAETEPAPYHFTQAEASLSFEAEEYSDSKLLDEYRRIAWTERMKTPLDAKRQSTQFDETVSRELSETTLGDLGIEEDVDGSDQSGGVASGDD